MMEIREKFKKYLQSKRFNLNYYYRIKPFLEYCQANNISLQEITFEQYQNFILTLTTKNLDAGTINNFINAVRHFYKFLIYRGDVNEDKLKEIYKLKLLKYQQKNKYFLTEEDLQELIKEALTYIDWPPLKLKTLLYFWFYTGLRKSELLRLKREDIKLYKCEVNIRSPTKNAKERIVIFPKKLTYLLKDYFDSELEEDNAFNLSEGKLNYLIYKLKDCTPDRKISCHTFRHSFGFLLATHIKDIRIAQKLLGHSNIQSTIIYYNPSLKSIKEEYFNKIKIKNL